MRGPEPLCWPTTAHCATRLPIGSHWGCGHIRRGDGTRPMMPVTDICEAKHNSSVIRDQVQARSPPFCPQSRWQPRNTLGKCTQATVRWITRKQPSQEIHPRDTEPHLSDPFCFYVPLCLRGGRSEATTSSSSTAFAEPWRGELPHRSPADGGGESGGAVSVRAKPPLVR